MPAQHQKLFQNVPRNLLDAVSAHHQFRCANNLVDPSFTVAMSEELTMRKRMMALQRAKEARPVEKIAKGNHIAFRNLMRRFDIAVADNSIEDSSRLLELIHWFAPPTLGMIESFLSLLQISLPRRGESKSGD